MAFKTQVMKKLSLLSFFAVFFMAIGFSSCSTEPIDPTFNNGTDGGSTAPASFQVNIGTDLYQATTTTGQVESNVLTLTATNAAGAKFVIQVPAARGTYSTSLITYTPNGSDSGSYTNLSTTGISGSVTIVSYNATTRKVSGTFNFTGYWTNPSDNRPSAQFTNGVFTNISFTDGTTTPTDFVFKVNAGSALFTATDAEATLGIGMVRLLGTDASGKSMGIQVFATQPGRYTGDKVILFYMSANNELLEYDSFDNSAVVEITEINTTEHTFTGTFSFLGQGISDEDTLNFTNGVFTDVPYTTDNLDGDLATSVIDGISHDYINSIAYVVTTDSGNNSTVEFPLVGADHWITFMLYTNLSVGNHALSTDPANTAKVTFTDAAGTEYQVSEGTIGITSTANNRIVGTYTLTVKNDAGATLHTITGTFNIDTSME